MRKDLRFALLVLCCCWCHFSLAQTITGEVYDKSQQSPIPGATILIPNTSRGTVTGAEGRFSIELKSGDKYIEVSHTGYKPQRLAVTAATHYRVELEASSLDQVVIVGYGTQKKANLTGAVATVDVKETFGSRPITDVARGLQGVVGGLTITTPNGEPGTDPKIRLRGLSGSLNTFATGAKPLILVDNVEIPSLQFINPDDIESFSVLKDAASASIYGTRGAWGVILITTKSGKKGMPTRVTYSNNLAWSKPINTPQLAGAADNAEAAMEAFRRTTPTYTEVKTVGFYSDSLAIAKMREWDRLYGGQDLGEEMVYGRDFEFRNSKLYFYRSWDPNKMYMKKWTLQQRHDLNVSGGSDKIRYSLGVGHMGQHGMLKANPDEFKRNNVTLSVNSTVYDWLDVRGKLLYSNTTNRTPFSYTADHYNAWYYLYRWPAQYPYGTYEGKSFRSALTEAQQASKDNNKNAMTRISLGATFKLLKGLSIDADYTYTSTNRHLSQTGGPTYGYDIFTTDSVLHYGNYQSPANNTARWISSWSDMNTAKLFATYTTEFGDHTLKFIAGSDLDYYRENSQSSERTSLIDPSRGAIDLTTGTPYVDGSNNHWSTLGFFGRINYAFRNRYLLELNGRYDGSSRFPVSDLWGFFPSVSAGWVLTEEAFMEPVTNIMSFFKLRASYGSVGNQAVGEYQFLAIMDPRSSGWLLPGGNAITATPLRAVSSRLTWETVNTINIGADARFLSNRLGISFDWFQRTTTNMLSPGVSLPASYGIATPKRNFGELQGRGFELAVDFTHRFANGLRIGVTGTLSDAVEKITKYSNTTKPLPSQIAGLAIANGTWYEGMTIGEIWGFETDRLFQEGDFTVDNNGRYVLKAGIPTQTRLETPPNFFFGPGDIKYKDLNGDGKIDFGTNTVDSAGDQKVIGNSTPRFQYGMRLNAEWKGFDISIYLQGVAKRDLWASGSIVFPGFRADEGWFAHQMDYWRTDNPNAFYPRPASYGAVVDRWNFEPQTRYLLNMAYFRVKNVNLGYTFSNKLIERVNLKQARVYLSAENLLTIDNLNGVPLDPEIDFTQSQIDRDRAGFGRTYPYRATVSAGLQMTF
jgi:TonB-linked outer membrane protein, SusC/RagA family